MKLVKKWLFPVLTGLLVAGAAVLPQRVSEARDARLLEAVHTETMAAESPPVRDQDAPNLTDRIDLYVRWLNLEDTIPSFRASEEASQEKAKELAALGVDMLISGDVFSPQVLQNKSYQVQDKTDGIVQHQSVLRLPEVTSWSYVLLWDPEKGVAQQEPYAIWELSAEVGSGSVFLTLDAESGLPLYVSLYDPNIDQWLPPNDPDALPDAAENFLALLELESEPMIVLVSEGGVNQCICRVKETDFYYKFDHSGNQLVVSPQSGNLAVRMVAYDAYVDTSGGT